jgi:hypothetical protein
MTADLSSHLDRQLADAAQDRTKLLAHLAREAAKRGGKSVKYAVKRQLFAAGEVVEHAVCGHRFEWVAQLCAHRRERQHGHEAGGHYTVRRADA